MDAGQSAPDPGRAQGAELGARAPERARGQGSRRAERRGAIAGKDEASGGGGGPGRVPGKARSLRLGADRGDLHRDGTAHGSPSDPRAPRRNSQGAVLVGANPRRDQGSPRHALPGGRARGQGAGRALRLGLGAGHDRGPGERRAGGAASRGHGLVRAGARGGGAGPHRGPERGAQAWFGTPRPVVVGEKERPGCPRAHRRALEVGAPAHAPRGRPVRRPSSPCGSPGRSRRSRGSRGCRCPSPRGASPPRPASRGPRTSRPTSRCGR